LPELIETDPHAVAVLADKLARHAAALHVVFMRGFAEILAKKERSLRDASRALRAQNQCRIALRLLLKLRAVMDSQKNREIERTDYWERKFPIVISPWKNPSESPLVRSQSLAHKGLSHRLVRRQTRNNRRRA